MPQKIGKRFIRIGLLLGTVVSLFFVPWPIVKLWISPLPSTISEQLKEVLDYEFEGAIVYIHEKGKPAAHYAEGWHNRENKIPATPKALFKIASINKLYVAVAVAKLAHRKQLFLDSSLAYYRPQLAGRVEYAQSITLRMMVEHRSGIPNYTSMPNYWANPAETNAERLKLILDQKASFKPGEGFEYSNTNYLLLREIMDQVLEQGYFEFLREEVLRPLNLEHTFESLEEVNIEEVMSGYHVDYPYDLKLGKQGMLATAEDVGMFLRALNEGSLFKDGEQEIYSSLYKYEHTGLIPGYQSIARYHKDIDAVVILFMNTTNFEGYHWNLSEITYNRIVKIWKRQNGY